MSGINPVLDHEISRWIITTTTQLQGRSRFCAQNAIRFLRWADDIYERSHVVSAFCAMHATEEAVAAFISAAKAHGPKTHAKQVNLHDHTSKALVSIYAQRLTILIAQGDLAISWNPKNNALAYRIMLDHEYRYGDLHLSVFRTQKGPDGTKDGYAEIGNLPSVDELLEEAKRVADIRNKLLYASNTGIPTGFINVDDALDREAKLSLGLIWAAIDLHMHPKQDASFLNQILKDMASFSSVSKKILPN